MGRDEQGRISIMGPLVYVGTELSNQTAHHIQMPVLGRDEQGRISIMRRLVDLALNSESTHRTIFR
jgi:hypothetical protein